MAFSFTESPDFSKVIDFGIEITEIHCHNCNGYIRFPIDKNLNGQHVLNCPKCGHEHRRIVKDGKITESRWIEMPDWAIKLKRELEDGTIAKRYELALTASNYSPTGFQTSDNSGCGSASPFVTGAWMNITGHT